MAENDSKEFLCTWKIENYSFSYQRCGQCIRSPLFKVNGLGGSEWTLLLYPRGYFQSTIDSVVCKLYRYQYNEGDESEEKITIDLRFELVNSNNIIVKISEFQNQEISRGAKTTNFELIKINKLQEEMELWPDDTLIIRCYLIKTHDVLPLATSGSLYSSCEAFTEICVDTFNHTWIITVPQSPEWFRKKEILFPDMLPIVICYKVSGNQISMEISTTVKYKYSRFIACIITFLDSKGNELFTRSAARLFSNDTFEFPGSIHKSMLDLTTCVPHNDINLKIKVSSSNDVTFSRINYCQNDLNAIADSNGQISQIPSAFNSLNPTQISEKRTESSIRLQNQLKVMFTDSKFTDVKLQADDEVFSAHKALLAARSPVFCAMFDQDMLESKTGVVEIHDVEPKILKCFLEYLYSGSVEDIDDEIAKTLLVVADKYEVLSLKDMCSGYLVSHLSQQNVCDILNVADMVNDETLKSAASDYVVENSSKILNSTEWASWVEENVRLATEIFSKLSQKLNSETRTLPVDKDASTVKYFLKGFPN